MGRHDVHPTRIVHTRTSQPSDRTAEKPELVGTVLEVVLQHDRSSDTPESMNLLKNSAFTRDETQTSTIFRNMKQGLIYTFQETLKSTRYTFADEQLTKARRY